MTMASYGRFANLSSFVLLLLLLSLSILISSSSSSSSAEVICEDLPADACSFAVSAKAKRCVLEISINEAGRSTEYQCRTSEVVVDRIFDWIETDECIKACGVDRNTVGISSDSLLEPQFTSKLCSPDCHHNCPNIVDLYSNLAAGEGVFLPDLCEANRVSPHRAMAEILSSGAAMAPSVPSSDASAPPPSTDVHI